MYKCVRCIEQIGPDEHPFENGQENLLKLECHKCRTIYNMVNGKWHSIYGKIKPWKKEKAS